MKHEFGNSTSTTVAVDASTLVLALNNKRRYARITNLSGEFCFLSLGGTAEVSSGIALAANGGFFEINALNLYCGAINGRSTSGDAATLAVEEGT